MFEDVWGYYASKFFLIFIIILYSMMGITLFAVLMKEYIDPILLLIIIIIFLITIGMIYLIGTRLYRNRLMKEMKEIKRKDDEWLDNYMKNLS